jgi:hypothetical protein
MLKAHCPATHACQGCMPGTVVVPYWDLAMPGILYRERVPCTASTQIAFQLLLAKLQQDKGIVNASHMCTQGSSTTRQKCNTIRVRYLEPATRACHWLLLGSAHTKVA